MKNLKILVIVAMSIVAITCSKKPDIYETSVETNDELSSDVLSRISKLGFDTANIIHKGDTIIVEEDIILYKSQLTKTLPRQATISMARLSTDTITVYIDFSFHPLLERPDIVNALNQFVSINSSLGTGGVKIKYTASANEADLKIHKVYAVNNVCGSADFPTVVIDGLQYYMQVGANMYLNDFFWSGLTSSQRRFLVAHEFGHNIGIRHTNWRGLGEPATSVVDGQTIGAYTVPGTNNTSNNPDPNSVFNGGSCGSNWNGFTEGDLNTIAVITNLWIPWL